MAREKLLFFVADDWYFWCHRLALAVGAKAAGYDVTIVTPKGPYVRHIEDAGLRHIPIELSRQGRNPAADLRSIAELCGIYRSVRPEIVHHVAIKPIIYGSLAARAASVRAVVNAMPGMGYVFLNGEFLSRAIRPFVKVSYRALLNASHTRTILQNPDDIESWVRWGVMKRERIELIRGAGVDTSKFVPTPEPEGTPLCILPARLLFDKGVAEFVQAARGLKRRGVACRFALVGECDLGNPRSVQPEQIKNWVEEGVVEHFGWRDDMARVHREAHVVCLPSYGEGLPKALLEAAASARPIVATDVAGVREIARHGENALLVPPRDAKALEESLFRVMTDSALRAALGAVGREMVMREFSQQIVLDQTLRLYDRMLSETKR
jgi:glycosyltransferase involved in cell wall biosynthesis